MKILLTSLLILVSSALHAATGRTMFADQELKITKKYLLLPVKNGAPKRVFQFLLNGALVREFNIELAVEGPPDWWAFYDMSGFAGKTLTVKWGNGGIPALFRQSDVAVEARDRYREALRPQFHFTARRGWNNDPNGLAYFNGEYHMFYQYNPFGITWGNMHWGHAVSKDLAHWTELPVAIYPRGLKDMAFSGGAFADHENRLGFGKGKEDVLIASYTSTGRGECIAVGTGRALTLTDIAESPVMKHHGRDPKIIRYEPEDKWVMVVYDTIDEKYGYAFYDSKDLKTWRRLSYIEGFHECPEFFEMPVEGESNRKWVLYGARMQRVAGKQRISPSSYRIGSFDGKTFTPETEMIGGHLGPNFYAAQTFSNVPDGRRILVGWLQGALYPGMPFSQGMTVPLELKLRRTPDGLRLCFLPVRELERLYGQRYAGKNLSVAQANALLVQASAELLDIDLDLAPGGSGKVTLSVHGLPVVYDPVSRELSCRGKKAVLEPVEGRVRLRVLVDRGVLELYANDGLVGMAFGGQLYSHAPAVTLEAGAEARVASLKIAKMKSIWQE